MGLASKATMAFALSLIHIYNELDLRNRLKAVGGSNGEEDDLFG